LNVKQRAFEIIEEETEKLTDRNVPAETFKDVLVFAIAVRLAREEGLSVE